MINDSATKYSAVKISIFRIVAISVLLFILISLEFGVYSTAIKDLHGNLMKDYEMTSNRGWQKSVAWIVNELGLWLPMITICVFQLAVYKRYNRENGILQKEMAFEVIVVGVLVYALLLPYVSHLSSEMHATAVLEETVEYYKNGDAITLMRESLEWFVRFIIPVGLLSLYHFTRSKAEIEESKE